MSAKAYIIGLFPVAKIPHLYPACQVFQGLFLSFFRKIPLMYSKWSLCFLVANIQFWKCEVKCFGKFFMKENKSYLVQYVSTKNIILRFMLGSQVCGPQVCEPIVIHLILINYHYKKVIFNTKTKTSMKKICFACWTNFPENRSKHKTNRRNSPSKIRNVWRRIRKSCWNVKAFFYFAKAYFYFAKAKIFFAKA